MFSAGYYNNRQASAKLSLVILRQLDVYLHVTAVGNAAMHSPRWTLAWTFTLWNCPALPI